MINRYLDWLADGGFWRFFFYYLIPVSIVVGGVIGLIVDAAFGRL